MNKKDRRLLEVHKTYREMEYWVVANRNMGFRCGYVGVPDNIDKAWLAYAKRTSEEDDELAASDSTIYETSIDCHGGITFESRTEEGDKWYTPCACVVIGFDCGHAGDGIDATMIEDCRTKAIYINSSLGEIRSTEYCEEECRSMIDQLWGCGNPDELAGVMREVAHKIKKEKE